MSTRPNIIFIFADDWGWGDLGCYGHDRLKTPNLDRLASQSTLFTQFYVCSGVCSPSRTAVMTGQFPARHGVHGHFADHDLNARRGMPNWLDTEGRPFGMMFWRFMLPEGEIAPLTTQLVPMADVAKA